MLDAAGVGGAGYIHSEVPAVSQVLGALRNSHSLADLPSVVLLSERQQDTA